MIGLEARFFDAADQLPGQRFDGLQQIDFVGADQRHRLTFHAGPASAADTVDVVLCHGRQVEVDHLRQGLDIQAARGDVGGDQQLHLRRLEPRQRAQAGWLGLVAMDGIGRNTVLLQGLDQLLDALARLDEHQHLLPAQFLEQMQQQLRLALLVGRDQPLFDRLGRGVTRADLDRQRIFQHAVRQLADLVRERGREQQGLALLGHCQQQAVEVAFKTQVQHAVRLIQHQRLQRVELDRALVQQVQQTAWRGHQHVQTLAQLADLRLDRYAAIRHIGAQRQVAAIGTEAVVDLLGQFARRHQYQAAHRLRAGHAFHGQALQNGQRETGGLAGARLRGRHQVAARQHGRNGLLLDRRGLLVAQRLESALDRIDKAEGLEGHGMAQT